MRLENCFSSFNWLKASISPKHATAGVPWIDPQQIPARKLPARKEEVELLLELNHVILLGLLPCNRPVTRHLEYIKEGRGT
jgi:hypothetical protein